jgi:hypothetical protein
MEARGNRRQVAVPNGAWSLIALDSAGSGAIFFVLLWALPKPLPRPPTRASGWPAPVPSRPRLVLVEGELGMSRGYHEGGAEAVGDVVQLHILN